ncbi:prepilin-type N-terminal cleavage/methylation domain-containing protein [Rheinheimera sp. D18]|uniref:prepilin-type N-terminal cleavage/methylation domain-containing protein n=1 Tax=Rheinheimera sp. D18 TaxID=2545632 RepID=UPI00104B5B5A|nr:prepilin-type N-terminal cleavage/methylation domain-containing protein [Rheinheimera sp. D18]QBL09787.1 prepilin-type N-terminal cleavage/methylation domain-containing protein [Rheinheimera sp. D18]
MKQRGFTLIEVLITLILLSMLVISGAMVFQYFQDNWQKTRIRFQTAMTDYAAWQLTNRVLTKTFPHMVISGQQYAFYFLGKEDGFTAVSHTSVQAPGSPAVYRLFKESLPDGSSQLVYEEAVIAETLLAEAGQQLPFSYRLVLFQGKQSINFEYFGWPSLTDREIGSDPLSSVQFEPRAWFTEYDGIKRRQHPLVVQINVEQFSWPVMVHDVSDNLLKTRADPEY